MLYNVALVRTDVSEKSIASIIRATRIGGLGTSLAVYPLKHAAKEYYVSMLRLIVTVNIIPSSPILVALMLEAICSSET
jgi:hypothetical protein